MHSAAIIRIKAGFSINQWLHKLINTIRTWIYFGRLKNISKSKRHDYFSYTITYKLIFVKLLYIFMAITSEYPRIILFPFEIQIKMDCYIHIKDESIHRMDNIRAPLNRPSVRGIYYNMCWAMERFPLNVRVPVLANVECKPRQILLKVENKIGIQADAFELCLFSTEQKIYL